MRCWRFSRGASIRNICTFWSMAARTKMKTGLCTKFLRPQPYWQRIMDCAASATGWAWSQTLTSSKNFWAWWVPRPWNWFQKISTLEGPVLLKKIKTNLTRRIREPMNSASQIATLTCPLTRQEAKSQRVKKPITNQKGSSAFCNNGPPGRKAKSIRATLLTKVIRKTWINALTMTHRKDRNGSTATRPNRLRPFGKILSNWTLMMAMMISLSWMRKRT